MRELCVDGRLVPQLIPMVGKRYGDLVVLQRVGRPKGACFKASWVRVKCRCGKVWTTEAHHVRSGRTKRCLKCHKATAKERRISVRLPSGRTVADIADATGLRLDTVYHRWIRGWPEKRLGQPARAHVMQAR